MKIKIKSIASEKELNIRKDFLELYKKSPIPENEILSNLGLYIKRQEFSKFLFFNEIYQQVLKIPGIIVEFGVRWGQNLVTFNNLRGIYEPYNYGRKIIGFDTFEGFASISKKDGKHKIIENGAFSVTKNYEDYLIKILNYHENESPLNHINKNFIIKGNAIDTLAKYLNEHPETIIAFAYFDMDIYEPTKECLKLIKPHLIKGSVIGFDELNDPQFPGETIALKEIFNLNEINLQKNKFGGIQSYFIY
ncbi:MAG: crotonobetainyl-CoA--carnitine CoA-transferase [Bacteroidia bacterium]